MCVVEYFRIWFSCAREKKKPQTKNNLPQEFGSSIKWNVVRCTQKLARWSSLSSSRAPFSVASVYTGNSSNITHTHTWRSLLVLFDGWCVAKENVGKYLLCVCVCLIHKIARSAMRLFAMFSSTICEDIPNVYLLVFYMKMINTGRTIHASLTTHTYTCVWVCV